MGMKTICRIRFSHSRSSKPSKMISFLGFYEKKGINSHFFLDKCLKSSKILANISKFVYFLVMFERHPLAVIMNSLYEKLLFETVRRGENSIVDNFGAFNWRPDSETVAPRDFACTFDDRVYSLGVGVST